MNYLTFLFIFILSVSIFANECPVLEGSYICNTQGVRDSFTVHQYKNKEGFQVYEIPSRVLVTDEQTRTLPDLEYTKNRKLISYCRIGELQFDYSQDVYDTDGIMKWRFNDHSRLYVSDEGALFFSSDYEIETIGESKDLFSLVSRCTPKGGTLLR